MALKAKSEIFLKAKFKKVLSTILEYTEKRPPKTFEDAVFKITLIGVICSEILKELEDEEPKENP